MFFQIVAAKRAYFSSVSPKAPLWSSPTHSTTSLKITKSPLQLHSDHIPNVTGCQARWYFYILVCDGNFACYFPLFEKKSQVDTWILKMHSSSIGKFGKLRFWKNLRLVKLVNLTFQCGTENTDFCHRTNITRYFQLWCFRELFVKEKCLSGLALVISEEVTTERATQ